MLNKIFLMGRLTRDPELRRTQTGTPVASFSLAVDRDFKDKATGERSTDFIDVVAWRQTAEFVSRYFTKGRMAVVEGRLQIRDWTDKEGGKRRSAEVIADQVYFGELQAGQRRRRLFQCRLCVRRRLFRRLCRPRSGYGAPSGGGTSLPSFLMMTANCRSNFDRIWS